MSRQFVKLSNLEQGFLYAVTDFFICNTPFGRTLNAVLEDEFIVKLPHYLADVNGPPKKLNEFKKGRNFFVYGGEKTSEQTNRVYSKVLFPKPTDWMTMCFCDTTGCNECECQAEYDSQLKYLLYKCECTKLYSNNFEKIRQKFELLNPLLKPVYTNTQYRLLGTAPFKPERRAASIYFANCKRKAQEEAEFASKKPATNDDQSPSTSKEFNPPSTSVPVIPGTTSVGTQTAEEDVETQILEDETREN